MTEPTGTQTLVTQDDRSPRRRLHDEITSDQQLAEFKAALPENVSVDRFRRALSTAINEKPELIEVYEQNPRSLFSALSKCASAGLLPDGKQGAINVYNTKQKQPDGSEKWVKTAQFLPMKDGLRYILAQFGWTLTSRVVYTNDEFEWTEQPPSIAHRVARGDRGEREYVYSIADHRDGRRIQRVIDKDEVAKRRAKAKTHKIWDEWTDAMWEKSGDHAIFDDVPLDETERDRIKAILEAQGLLADPTAALFPPSQDRPARAAARDVPPTDLPPAGEAPQAAPQPDDSTGGGGSGDSPDWPSDEEPAADAEQGPGDVVLPDGCGRWAGLTIAAVAQQEPGREWLLKALAQLPVENEHRQAIAGYMAAELPETWERYCGEAA